MKPTIHGVRSEHVLQFLIVQRVNSRLMAVFRVSPPEAFDFSKPDSWPRWIRRFERFRQALGLETKGQESQVNTLIQWAIKLTISYPPLD